MTDIIDLLNSINIIQQRMKNIEILSLLNDIKKFNTRARFYDDASHYNYYLIVPYLGTYHNTFAIYDNSALQISNGLWNSLFENNEMRSDINDNYIILQQISDFMRDNNMIKIKPYSWAYAKVSNSLVYEFVQRREFRKNVTVKSYFLTNTVEIPKEHSRKDSQCTETGQIYIHYENNRESVLFSPLELFNYKFDIEKENRAKIIVSKFSVDNHRCNVLFICLDFTDFSPDNYERFVTNPLTYIKNTNFPLNRNLLEKIIKYFKK